jgi:hypothetical protein
VSSVDRDGKIVVSLKHSLDKVLYNFPLTLKTYVDPDWKNVMIKQGEKTVTIVPASDEKGIFVLYQATPNAEDIEISLTE